MINRRFFRLFLTLLMIGMGVTAVASLTAVPAIAGIYNASGETIYQEKWIPHSQFTGPCGSDKGNTWYIEPWGCDKSLTFDLPALGSINKVEIYIDYWRNHDEQVSRFRINGGPVIKPNVGSEWSRTPYIKSFSNAQLASNGFQSGSNTITFFTDSGGYHIHDVAIRVYTSSADVATTGGALGGVTADNGAFDAYTSLANTPLVIDSDQLVLTATVTGSAKFVEFHAYYDGYDEDNDGDFTDWHNSNHNNWNPGGKPRTATDENPNPELGGTINHIQTVAVNGPGVYQATWDVSHIISQPNVRFKVRIVDDNYNVRDAAGGQSGTFDLVRNTPNAYFTIPNFVDNILHNEGQAPNEWSQTIKLPQDISDFDSAYLIGAYWNNLYVSINGSDEFPAYTTGGKDGHWYLSIINTVGAANKDIYSYLQGGTNTITYHYWDAGNQFGAFIEKPGPMLVLKRENSPSNPTDVKSPEFYGESPVADSVFVKANANVSISVIDTNSGLDWDTLVMKVEGNEVSPTITGNAYNVKLFYNPPSDFAPGSTIDVDVSACDVAGNCGDITFSFVVTPPNDGLSANSDDFNVCKLSDSSAGWAATLNGGTIAIDETAEKLQITVPAGSNHDVTQNGNNSVRLMQDTDNAPSFILETKFESVPTQKYQIQGILVEETPGHFLRFDVFYDGSSLRVFSAIVDGNTFTAKANKKISVTGNTVYLSVVRSQTDWDFFWSADGVDWFRAGPTFSYVMNVDKVGVYAGNNEPDKSTPAPEFIAKVDYFLNAGDPFVGEEDGTALLLPVNIVGSGQVDRMPGCGQPAMLEATADLGWEFDSWSGAATGNQNPKTVTTWDKGESVTATFVREEYTLDTAVSGLTHDGQTDTTSNVGSVQLSPSSAIYYYGDEVTVTAVAAPGWRFDGWEGAGIAANAGAQVMLTMSQSESVTAKFVQEKYTITTDVQGVGDIVVDSSDADGRDYYIYGDEVTFTAVQTDADWNFIVWQGDASGGANPLTVSVVGDMSVTAVFSDTYFLFLPLVVR